MHRIALAAAIALGVAAAAAAQDAKPAFELASVKRNMTGAPSSNANTAIITPLPGGRLRVQNSTLYDVIRFVYGMNAFGTMLREDQITGGPEWLRTDRFDIDAKAEQDVPRDRLYLMAQTLLESRFAASVRKVQREGDRFVLTVARADGRLGPDLRKAADDCAEKRPTAPAAIIASIPKSSTGARTSIGQSCAEMSAFVRDLERALGAPVVDRTGLAGRWDYAVAHSGQPSAGAAPTDDRPALLPAVEQQLGLKVQRTRGPVDVFVIESVQPPTEN